MRTLRQTLDREGLTHEEAAHALGVARVTIYRWLDEPAITLPGRACLWCAGMMRVVWPAPFKPELELSIPPEATDAALERRLELTNRLLRTAVKAFTDVNDLRVMLGREEYPYEEEAHGPGESQGDDWNLSEAEKSMSAKLTDDASLGMTHDMQQAIHDVNSEKDFERATFTLMPSDIALINKLAEKTGNKSAAIRLLLRSYGRRLIRDVGGEA